MNKNIFIQIFTFIVFTIFIGCDGSGPKTITEETPSTDNENITSTNNEYHPDPVFSDEFNGDSLDTTIWDYETGYGSNGWGNNEWQTYTTNDENVRVEDGKLVISARRTLGGANNGFQDDSVTSGRIITLGKISFKYGKIQARIKIPYQLGLWPAFWMMGDNFATDGWPECGEIDIMESFALHLEPNQNTGNLHWFNEDPEWIHPTISDDPATINKDESKKCDTTAYNDLKYPYVNVGDFSAPLYEDYHIYEIEWDREKIVWKVDGIAFYQEYINDSNQSEFHANFFILLNLAVGGNLGGTVTDKTFPLDANNTPTPQNMYVDWIRVYQKETPFIVISSDKTIKSNVVFDDITIGNWDTHTHHDSSVTYQEKNCWELASRGSWGSVLAFQSGIHGNFSQLSKLNVSIATTGGYDSYQITLVPDSGNDQVVVLPVDDTITSWQEISMDISGMKSIKQIAIAGMGGEQDVSKIYVTDFNLIESYKDVSKTVFSDSISDANTLLQETVVGNLVGQIPDADATNFSNAIIQAQAVLNKAVTTQYEINAAYENLETATNAFKAAIIPSGEKSVSLISSGSLSVDTQVNEWNTGTQINSDAEYKGKKCWELTSSEEEEGNWGTVLALQGGFTDDYSEFNKVDVTIATTGGYDAYKVSIVPKQATRSAKEFILPVDDDYIGWQEVSVAISGITSIDSIAVFGMGGRIGDSKIYIADLNIVKDETGDDTQDFVIIASDTNIQSDVEISDTTVGEWSTGTQINPEGEYEGKNCWELVSNGSWGTVLAFQDGINGDFSDYSNLKISIATTGGYNDYKVAFVPSSGNNKEFPLPVNDAITSWQDISVEISGLNAIKQIAVIGGGGNAGTSKIYVTDFTLETGNSGTVTQKFVIIPSDANTQSDVAFSNDTVGEWSTGTTSNGEAEFKDKKCWELTSGSKTADQGNWGTVLVFQNGINGDFSQYSKIKVNIATTGEYSAYKLSLSAFGVGKEVVLPIDNQVPEWQAVSIDIIDIPLNLKSIDFIAVLGVGGTPGTSKFYVTDFEIVKDKEVTLAEIDDDYILKSSDPNINSNLIVDGDNNSDTGNIIFGEWGTQTKRDDATFSGLDCWKLTAVAGWGAVLALQGDISDGTNIDNYDVDLSKYTNIKFKIASEGGFERYALSIESSINGNSVSQEVGFNVKDQASWNEIDIDLDNYGVDLSNVSQMALFGVYPGGAAAGQTIYITDFIIYDTGIVGNNEKDSSDDKFVFKSSTDEQVDIVVDGDDCAHNGNITINDWSTNTVLQDTEYKGSNCWELKKGNGWGAVLALMGDMYGDVMTYDIDLTKYSTLNIKMAAEGAFTKYLIKFIGGAEFAKEFSLTADWKDFSINLNEIPLNLLKLQQIVIYGEGGNAGDKLYITDLNISK
jgi:beta-glucanase (GH16 family)